MFFRSKGGAPKERRRTARVEGPALAAFYWTGGVSTACRVRNVCRHGAYIETNQEWYAGTVLHVVLEPHAEANKAFGLWARVVHTGAHGMGMEFKLMDRDEELAFNLFLDMALRGNGAP
jgi:hypothetical protein